MQVCHAPMHNSISLRGRRLPIHKGTQVMHEISNTKQVIYMMQTSTTLRVIGCRVETCLLQKYSLKVTGKLAPDIAEHDTRDVVSRLSTRTPRSVHVLAILNGMKLCKTDLQDIALQTVQHVLTTPCSSVRCLHRSCSTKLVLRPK